MSVRQSPAGSGARCPNCGAEVVYRGVGRRPIWCSTRCRNDASLKRLGSRRAGVEVRIVEVNRYGSSEPPTALFGDAPSAELEARASAVGTEGSPGPTVEQALRAIRNDPECVARLMSHLERRRIDGSLMTPDWMPVRNALRLIASALPGGVERPG